MGTVSLPSLDAIMQIKDPNRRFEELVNTMGILIKNLSEINGYLSSKNIKAQSIKTESLAAGSVTAEKISVNQLSAISADLGIITAGLVQAITMIGSQIYGTYIATANGTYPRAEMSNTLDMFRAMLSATQYVSIESYTTSSIPGIVWRNGSQYASIDFISSNFNVGVQGRITLGATGNITLDCFGDIYLIPIGSIRVNSWSKFVDSSNVSLQTVLNSKANAFSGATTSFETGDGRTANYVNGILVSVV